MRLTFAIFSPLALTLAAQTLLDNYTPDALEKLGAEHFRQGRLNQASNYFAKAIEKQPDRLPALLAQAIILESGFHPKSAAALYRRALAIDPQSPAALGGISRTAQSYDERLKAARQHLPVSTGPEADIARRQVRLLEALGSRPVFEPADPGKSYTFNLEAAGPNAPPGADFPVLRITAPNGEKLTFLIGTANDDIWLTRHAAKALGARLLFKTHYPWFDRGRLLAGAQAIIDTLELGELKLRNCPAFVRHASKRFMYGVDGVIGTSIFHHFLIELDAVASELRLTPHSDASRITSPRDFVAIRKFGPFLLAPIGLDPELTTYFAVNSIASGVLFQDGKRPKSVRVISEQNTRTLTGWTCSNAMQHGEYEAVLTVAAARWTGPATSCQMDDLNRAAGFKVTGVLGYSFLHGFNLVIDYRRGLMGFIPQFARGAQPPRRP